MNTFEILRITRDNILKKIDPFDKDQLNFIPAGFNNNLIWNFGHVIVTQQLLCYKLSNLALNIDPTLIDKYRKGSKPDELVSEEEIELLKNYAFSTVDQMEKDFEEGLFVEYEKYTTSYNITLDGIEKAMDFNNVHEGMHFGMMIAIAKFLN